MKKSILDFIQTEVKARKGTIAQFIEDSGIGGSPPMPSVTKK
jgi:hypothetical protein